MRTSAIILIERNGKNYGYALSAKVDRNMFASMVRETFGKYPFRVFKLREEK